MKERSLCNNYYYKNMAMQITESFHFFLEVVLMKLFRYFLRACMYIYCWAFFLQDYSQSFGNHILSTLGGKKNKFLKFFC